MSRPTKFTPETIDKIIAATKAGMTRSLTAKYAGISAACLYKWLAKGSEGKPGFVEFLDAFREAEAVLAYQNLKIIRRAALKDWKAAAWILKNRHNYGHDIDDEVVTAHERRSVAELLDQLKTLNTDLLSLTGPKIDPQDL